MKKKILFGMLLSLLCLYLSCTKEGDSPTPTPEQKQVEISGFSPSEGEPDTEVTITGKNFSATKNENTVKFNGTAASVVMATATSLKVSVPDGSTSGKITISVGNSSDISDTDFDVYSPAKWTKVEDYPNPEGREDGVSFVIDDIIYSGLGDTNGHLTDHELWGYDPSSNTWTKKADFPLNTEDLLRNSAVFVVNGKAYVVGGYSFIDGDSSEVWEYDPSLGTGGTWTLKETPFPGLGKVASTGFSFNGSGYVVGGGYNTGEGTEKVNEVWVYDPMADSWTAAAAFVGPAFDYAKAFVAENKVYLLLGRTDEDVNGSNEFWEYDPQNDSWAKKANITGKRLKASGFELEGKIYIGYGYSESDDYQDYYIYSPETNIWTESVYPEEVTKQSGAIGESVNGVGYMGLGHENGPFTQSFWKFELRKKL